MKSKLDQLLTDKAKTLKKITEIKEKFKEEKDNEEAWPGHDSTSYLDEMTQMQVMEDHLQEIEKEIAALQKKISKLGPEV